MQLFPNNAPYYRKEKGKSRLNMQMQIMLKAEIERLFNIKHVDGGELFFKEPIGLIAGIFKEKDYISTKPIQYGDVGGCGYLMANDNGYDISYNILHKVHFDYDDEKSVLHFKENLKSLVRICDFYTDELSIDYWVKEWDFFKLTDKHLEEPYIVKDLHEKIGNRFSKMLFKKVVEQNLAYVIRKNKKDATLTSCLSNIFCEPNLLMVKAFEHIIGREPKQEPGFDNDLCNKAWEIAKKNDFYFKQD